MDADLKQYLEAMEGRLNEHFNTRLQGLRNALEGRTVRLGTGLEGMGNRLIQELDAIQTELLRVFASASEDQAVPLRRM